MSASRSLLLPLALALTTAVRADVVIPSAAFSLGRNNAEFHSDVRVFNPALTPASVVPAFFDQSTGETVRMSPLRIAPRQQVSYDNVLQSLFGRSVGSFGPIRFESATPLVVSSSVNNVNGCGGGGAVLGQWLPGLDTSLASRAGVLVQLASSADAALGYRTNLGFMNAGASPAHVTVRIRKGDGSLLSSAAVPTLPPNGFVQKALDDPLFAGVAGTTDTNLWAEVTSDVPILAFASVINNVSGDPFAIVMTQDSPVPVASYSVSPEPASVGQAVKFTDASSEDPATQLWWFGDGSAAVSGAAVTHAYAAAGVYRSAHFVVNAAGASFANRDITVSGSQGPTEVLVTASQYTYDPKLFVLTAGVPYRITWRSADTIHGVQIDELGVDCPQISQAAPCVVTVTPKPSLVGTYTYHCTTFCGAGHEVMAGQFQIKAP